MTRDLQSIEVKGFIQENTIDTTGAGDTFMGCCINHVLENGFDKLEEMLKFANAAASIVTTRKGALKAMPTTDEITSLQSR